MASLPIGTVTFLFTDIEGSTRLAQQHRDKWERLQKRHHAILHSAIESHNGYIFQIVGDAIQADVYISRAYPRHSGTNEALPHIYEMQWHRHEHGTTWSRRLICSGSHATICCKLCLSERSIPCVRLVY